ncbi:hypothetical protein A6R68_00328, partial [Neotoma lepida]
VLAYTLSCVCTSAFSAGIIEAVEAEDIMNKLQLLVENNQQGASTMLCLAALHGLVALVGSDVDVMQLKSEAIQNAHVQARLNEVIRTLTE